MSIVHIRIDDRLIHGQVATFWSSELKIDRIMVPNDEIAADDLQKNLLRMAAPAGVHTSLITKAKAAENIKAGKYDKERVMMVLKGPKDALDLIKLGVEIKAVNVGNMAYREGKISVKHSVNVSQEEIQEFRELDKMGVELTSMMVPDERSTNLMTLINETLKKK